MSDIFFDWVNQHLAEDPAKLRLKYRDKNPKEIDFAAAITQIECRRKFGNKLNETLRSCPSFIFPASINGEQSTSDRLARWHCSLVKPGQRIADLTAGLGIDALHLCRISSEVVAVEIQPSVASILKQNARSMGINNLKVVCEDCGLWLNQQACGAYDRIFIDPARRAYDGSRVYALSDCSPNLCELQSRILRVATGYIAKLSPMLDLTQLVADLHHLRYLYAVGTPTECKELVAVAEQDYSGECQLGSVTIDSEDIVNGFYFYKSDELASHCCYGMPKQDDWLFVPWPSTIKAAPLKLLSDKFGLTKIAANTHLYWTTEKGNAPGNYLHITTILPYSSGNIKRFRRSWPEALVAVRNFGLSADALRKKLGVRDGGTTRVFGVCDEQGDRWLIICAS